MEFIGVGSLPIIGLVGLFSGMVSAQQTIRALSLFGQERFVGATVGLSLALELAPVFTALMITARAGSGMATELGSMRITEQIDALTTFAVNPIQYLVTPRIVASIIMMPVMTMVFNVVGLVGAYFYAIYVKHVDLGSFIEHFRYLTDPSDYLQGASRPRCLARRCRLPPAIRASTCGVGPRKLGSPRRTPWWRARCRSWCWTSSCPICWRRSSRFSPRCLPEHMPVSSDITPVAIPVGPQPGVADLGTRDPRWQIKIRDLNKTFGPQHVLRGVDLDIERGKINIIIGGSGQGKSVLMKHLMGLLKPDSGHIYVDGQDIVPLGDVEMGKLRRKFGMVFQYAALFDSLNVVENIAFPLIERYHLSRDEIMTRVRELLNRLDLGQVDGIEQKFPAELSGGQRKRVGLARALDRSPRDPALRRADDRAGSRRDQQRR